MESYEHIAYEYAKKGASLVLVARRENSLREVARKAVQLGSPDVLAVPADVSKVHECKKFVEEAVNHFGRLDHLVCNAGIISFCAFEDITGIGNFTPLMDINFWGSIYTTSFAIPHLKKTKGKIIANASSSGWLISPTLSLYGASKAAVINFYERLRKELEPDVKVTIAALGFIESEMSQGKHLDNEGVVKVNQEMRDVSIGILPILSVGKCAESIVNKACRGERYVIEPPWFKVLILIQFLCPTLLEWAVHFLYVTKSGTPVTNARNKKILDAIGGKKFLYPSSILSSQIKKD
ncbi:PREDICTED: 11-beta-hydroxysteroid dehydrogenase 1B-like isoform X2 [Nelumbo nucifera]|uniref:11-beta-hydroxysteroid dehydrogenase 1B-like n=2 Tax=Nelumbo nucifera TaxID=4432 RepID=A0A822YG88_NELNU|nr:PREDICTED: 11-beta-hydroxysteroid dehydrogenase 1B-like isoform X2 [Nelumbo nucifera]DAD30501.1 TPA_asm: hypothetical protein HUJ06_009352 [Nelumbo nucifera]